MERNKSSERRLVDVAVEVVLVVVGPPPMVPAFSAKYGPSS